MRFLIVDTYYEKFLRSTYAAKPGLAEQTYDHQWRTLMGLCFGTADFYSLNLRSLGHQAEEVVANCSPLQRQWAREKRPDLARVFPVFRMAKRIRAWQHKVLAAQIEALKPDILYIQSLNWMDGDFLRSMRPKVRLVVGQNASPLRPGIDYSAHDLILTSFPHYVAVFRHQGVPSEYFRIAFEPEVLRRLGAVPQDVYETVHVGGYTDRHRVGVQILEQVARQIPADFWGYGVQSLSQSSPIRKHYHGEVWGLEMYRVLAQSKIILNRHIDVAGRLANNMRLYETTGVGTCLVTDMKDNLHELFEIDKEVVVYTSAEDCVRKVRYLLEHEHERAAIAKAGQARTLREHTYYQRMQELVDIVERHLRRPESSASRCTFALTSTRPGRRERLPPELLRSKAVASARALIRRTPFRPLIRALRQRLVPARPVLARVSYAHHVIRPDEVNIDLVTGWQNPDIPARQRQLVNGELARMYQGDVVPVYRIAAEAIRATGLEDPFIIEVGCASGYYSEVLTHLLGYPVRYLGVDYSAPLLRQARQYYPHLPFIVADATALPLPNACCDILFSPALLMHIPAYEQGLRESVRVSRSWCIFHRTPVVSQTPTTYLSKYAYGVPVVELVFNETEILDLFAKCGAKVIQTFTIHKGTLPGLDELVAVKSYVCRLE